MRFKVYSEKQPANSVEFESDSLEKAQKSALSRMSRAGYTPEGKINSYYGSVGWIKRDGRYYRTVAYGMNAESHSSYTNYGVVLEVVSEASEETEVSAKIMSAKKMVSEGWAMDKAEAEAKLDYWNSLDKYEKDGFLSMTGTEGDTPETHLIGCVCEAYRRSPEMVAKRAADKEAYDNELLECSRSGEMVARKDGVMIGDTFTAFVSLSDAEANFLGIEKPAKVETEKSDEYWKLTQAYIRTGRRSYLTKRSQI